MKLLIIQREAVPKLKLIEDLAKRAQLLSIFLTSDACVLASKSNSSIEQDTLLKSAKQFKFEILVCGRAFAERGFKSEDLNSGFILSGNMELVSNIVKADKILEF